VGREPVSLLIERAHVIWEVEGPRRALKSLEFIDESKLSYEERELLAVARASNLFQTGDLSVVAAAERRASATLNALESGRGLDLASSSNAIVVHATNCGALERFDASERVVERGLEFFARSGALLAMAPLHISRLGVLLHRGALVETVAGVDDLEEEMELGPLLTPYVMSFKVRALVALGRLDEARRTEDAVLALPGSSAWYVRLGLEMARGQSLAVRGRLDDACWMYDGIEATVDSVGLEQPCILPWVGEAIDVALLAGRVEDAERRTEWLDARRADEMGVWPRMVALAGRAGVAAARGDRDAADAAYAQALAEPSLFELERARIALRYGTWLRHHGAAVRARPWLAEALTIAENRGAAPLADEARLELSAAGGRRRRRAGADELTTQQARVAALAATGATNREIAAHLHISARTVESHLAAALLKLNLRTRAELRQRRRELGLVQG
jgi:DNA-binding CsgD family transcriptional regulator